ncbi:MAG: glycosyltransferase family 39 protein [bacterium]
MDPVPTGSGLPRLSLRALLATACAVVALIVASVHHEPPVLAESFEYAELARNWLESGELREDHYRDWFPATRALGLPHPAGQRANAYVLVVMPFVALFGASTAAVVIPGILGHLFLAWSSLRFARTLFDEGVARWTALAMLVHPRLVYTAASEPHPAAAATAFALLALAAFARRRYLAAGACAALGWLFHAAAALVLPVFPLWIVLRDRAALGRRELWVGALAGLAILSPMLVRNAWLFGNPLAMESHGEVASYTAEQRNTWTRLEQLYRYTRDAPSAPAGIAVRARAQLANFRHALAGEGAIDWYPGLFELIGLAVVPFAAWGAWRARHRHEVQLLLLASAVLLATYAALTQGHEDRYLFPLLPIALALALDALSRRPSRSFASAVLALVLLGEIVPATWPMLQDVVSGDSRPRRMAAELARAEQWLADTTPAGGRILSFPSFSTAYFTRRRVIPFPAGGSDELRQVVREHTPDTFLYVRLFGDQPSPRADYLRAVATGEFVTVGIVDRNAPGLAGADWSTSWSEREPLLAAFSRVSPIIPFVRRPLWGYWTAYLPHPAFAVLAYGAAACAFVWVWARARWRGRAGLVAFSLVATFASRMGALAANPARAAMEQRHPVATESLRALLASNATPLPPLVLASTGDASLDADYAREIAAAIGVAPEPSAEVSLERRPEAAIAVPLPEPREPLVDAAAFAASEARWRAIEQRSRALDRLALAAGRRSAWLGGLWIALPAGRTAP